MKSDQYEIALLGTSADPPTYGHQALLEGLVKLFPKVATWASDNPMKLHGASLKKRKALLKVVVEAIANPNLELVQELSSPRTITTLRRASSRWPTANFIFVIGSDLTEQISTWTAAKSVFKKARIGIAPRQGWPIEKAHLETLESLGAEVELLPLSIPASSSSNVRANADIAQIPPVLLPLLLEENLYELNSNQ